MGYTKVCNHPQPSTTTHNIHNQSQPFTITHNHPQTTTTTHNHPQPPTTIHNHPQPSKTIHNNPKITQKSHNLLQTVMLLLLDVNTETEVAFDGGMKQYIYIYIHIYIYKQIDR